MNVAILGLAWGDEAKAAVAHRMAPDFDFVIRTSGGSNCGHTIYDNGKKYVHHLLPCLDFNFKNTKAFLGSGMVVSLEELLAEITEINKSFDSIGNRIIIDPDAFIVTKFHKRMDAQTNSHIGTTNKGIGPTYSDKTARRGIRINHLLRNLDCTGLLSHLATLEEINEYIAELKTIVSKLVDSGVQFIPSLAMKDEFLRSKLLFEGAQGALLSLEHGSFPYVTSSDCTVSGAYASGFNFLKIDKIYGITKCYVTKVGEGPFPTEIFGKACLNLQTKGNEIGSTTGRLRRCGWLDLPALKYACDKSGVTDLIVTKLDILEGMDQVTVCQNYDHEPTSGFDFFEANRHFSSVHGWKHRYDHNIDKFLTMIESHTGKKVSHYTYGVERRDMIEFK